MPHSEIPGSTIARISPRLIAACYVLHRLSVPRHPPDALRRLISASSTKRSTAHRGKRPTRTQAPYIDTSPRSRNNLGVHPQPIRAEARFSQRREIVPSSHSLHNVQYPRPLARPPRAPQDPRSVVLSRSSFCRQLPLFSHQVGGGGRDRTDDLMLAKHALSQLSYAPNVRLAYRLRLLEAGCHQATRRQSWWAREDLNLRPHAYQARALTS